MLRFHFYDDRFSIGVQPEKLSAVQSQNEFSIPREIRRAGAAKSFCQLIGIPLTLTEMNMKRSLLQSFFSLFLINGQSQDPPYPGGM